MPSYSYIVHDASGRRENGSLIAEDEQSARNALIKRGWEVESLHAQGGAAWVQEDQAATSQVATSETRAYVPLTDTLRLFFGWLLAWYGLVYILGTLQYAGKISRDIPFIEAMYTSPVILRLTFGTFLFLLLTSLHKVLGRGVLIGMLLTIVWVGLMMMFHVNV